MRNLFRAGLVGGGAILAAVPAGAQTVQLGVGADYSSGAYGGSRETSIYEIPLTARLKAGAWSFRARIPFAMVDGPGGVVPGAEDDSSGGRRGRGRNRGRGGGGDEVTILAGNGADDPDDDPDDEDEPDDKDEEDDAEQPDVEEPDDPDEPDEPEEPEEPDDPDDGDGDGESGGNDLGEIPGGVRESGLADMSLSATWSGSLGGDAYVDITGRLTLPTGDETRDLGVGETDYGLSAEIGHDTDAGGIYMFGGYKVRGGATRNNGMQAGFGGYRRLTGGVIVGVDATWAEASLSGFDSSADLTVFSSFPIAKQVRMSVYAVAGLTENSPDAGAGMTFTWRPNFRRPTE